MSKAILYGRFSPRRNSAECDSIETQLDQCRTYCEQHGHTIVEAFTDPDYSGGDEDRPGIWNAIDALKRGYVLVAYRADRIARSVYLSELIHRDVSKKGATIEVVSGSRNGEAAEDVFVRQILAAFSEYERKVTAARTKAAMLRHQANGRAMGSVPPYGKRPGSEPGSLEDDPLERANIFRILELYATGGGLREIARRLNTEGVPSRGKSWDHTAIRRIVRRSVANAETK